ncbi:2-oxo-hepta-3-ene-1,7-dioic acid hydratase [Pseudomonas aeruginosa]|nr:2-oxo-hepta-3-ene-1,7-dioic acid hydratase [Pseudomonas aeruginosa]
MFLIEGLPVVLLGVVVWCSLPESFERVTWLSDEQKHLLREELAGEEQRKTITSFSGIFSNPQVWLLVAIYFAVMLAVNTIAFWMPSLIHGAGIAQDSRIGMLSAVPYLAGCAFMIFIGRSSDRLRERRWHLGIPLLMAAAGLSLGGPGTDQRLAGDGRPGDRRDGRQRRPADVLANCRRPSFPAPPWPPESPLISSFGSIAAFLAPYLIGWMRDTTQSASLALYLLAILIALGAGLVLRTPRRRGQPTLNRETPTMLDPRLIQEAANRLDAAERSRQQVRQFSLDYPDIAIEDAYAIQRAWVERKIADGRVLKGHKIGLTSRAMQVSSNISEPDYGALLDDMFFEEGSDIPFQRFIVPRVEVELAFILGKPLKGPGCTLFDVLEATEWVIPALEIIDARIQQVDPQTKVTRKVFDTISDNAANAGVVMGGRAVRPGDIDLRRVPAILYRNGVIEESGVSAAVLNHPAKGVAWLANKLAPYGVCLEAGQVILGGSFTRPVAAAPGDTFHVDYDLLGSISCRFV